MQKLSIYFVCVALFAVFSYAAAQEASADMCIPACLASPSDFGLTDCDPSVSEADCELSNGDQCQSLCQLLFSTAPNECGACHSALRSACAAEHKSKKKKKEIVEIFKQLLCAADNAGGHACTDCQD